MEQKASYKHLKDRQYYNDLYDRHTVEQCRRAVNSLNEIELPPLDGKELSKEEAGRMKPVFLNLILHFETGERYIKKEEIINEWMEEDRKRDELYENAVAPENIRCLTCRNQMKPTLKEFWSVSGKSDRVLFMYDCPNRCLPRRAFFSDGEEWRVKPHVCPRCGGELNEEVLTNNEKELSTKYTCPKCSHAKTDSFTLSGKKEEETYDENFASDRDRFCLSKEDGEKYREERWRLEQMGKFMDEWKEKEKAREEKLKANPNGFHLEGSGYTCFICGNGTPEGDNWYDQWGIKCLVCQKAIDIGEIPASFAKEKEGWYTSYELQSRFNVKSPTIRKWVRHGILKARTISYYGKGEHYQLFVIEDNKDFLPPKNLTESVSTRQFKGDGSEWVGLEPWYKSVDPKERLKGYKILDYLKFPDQNK
jgi:hypothetical protein